ncbi:Uncharacterized protein Fot_20288 [Forsythia ovata]|uniref:Cytochrome b5 heme-binding domain-containing protein n=1 Tax=Forsythia ovata TaxID=205694 RepID=A0ABD1VNS9_9LAMI
MDVFVNQFLAKILLGYEVILVLKARIASSYVANQNAKQFSDNTAMKKQSLSMNLKTVSCAIYGRIVWDFCTAFSTCPVKTFNRLPSSLDYTIGRIVTRLMQKGQSTWCQSNATGARSMRDVLQAYATSTTSCSSWGNLQGEIIKEELKKYDGSKSKKPLIMVIKGQIYDVSQSMYINANFCLFVYFAMGLDVYLNLLANNKFYLD